jgi:ribosome recycling factor|tara:strand:+ start:2058 stop:2609 length:552 start_codon:yes stop_codon:yes gene_type:complete
MEDFKIIIDTIEELMKNSVAHLDKSFLNIRAGKATPMMLNSVSIDYFGTNTPLNQVANINTPNSQTISVQPWDKSIIPEIEKAIITSNLGFNPMNNGESVIINVPPLTEDRRKDLVKQAKAEAENSKISIRTSRKEANSEIKNLSLSEDEMKNAELDIQNLTNNYISLIDEKLQVKEKEIMTV